MQLPLHKEMVAMIHRASFDIQTADDFFMKVVLPQYAEFINDNSCARKALIAIIVAYHMCEWVYKTKCNDAKSNFQSDDINDLFELGRRITNGTKHFKPRIVTKRQAGFSSAFSDGFAHPLIIVRDNGPDISADQLLRELIAHWEREKATSKF